MIANVSGSTSLVSKQMSERGQRIPVAIPDEKILEAIRSIKFGTVTLTIQNNKVVQLDKTGKVRLDVNKRDS